MKRKSRNALVMVAALLALVAGAAVWVLQGKEPERTTAMKLTDPSIEQLQVFGETKIFFGHQSVGSNIISGVAATYDALGKAAPEVVETRDAVDGDSAFLAHSHMGVNGDPRGKLADFVSVLNGPLGDQVDVALVKLCYVDVVAGTNVDALFDDYTKTMADLEARHPSVTFLFTTVPLTTDRGWKSTIKSWLGQDDQMGPADNLARQRYNELIRTRYASTGRLFDIAAVQATMADSPTQRTLDGATYYVLNGGLAADPGHLNELGSRVAASEFIRMVAGTVDSSR